MKKNKLILIKNLLSAILLVLTITGCKVANIEPEQTGNSNNITSRFEALHNELSTRYAFSEWKSIDWNAKYQVFYPQIARAESENDNKKYYLALRGYVHSIPDTHVRLSESSDRGRELFNNVRFQEIGGSFGFILIGLDDGRIVFSILSSGGPAEQAGIKFGAEIIKWNGQPINTALKNVPLLWASAGLATNEIRKIHQYYFISRGSVGSTASVTFRNPSTDEKLQPVTVQLTAVDDNYQSWYIFQNFFQVNISGAITEYNILPEGYGYLKITTENLTTISQVETAMQSFITNKVPGIILDLRDNNGGYDQVAADICGFFYNEQSHYEHIYSINLNTGIFEHSNTINIEPRSLYFDGKIIVLVGPFCLSSGEGPPKYIQMLPNGEVISFYGSNGSFGISGAQFNMPNGLIVNYANGQSRDVNHVIQIDGNAEGIGGITPDLRVPINEKTLNAAIIEKKDVELEFAIQRMKEILGN